MPWPLRARSLKYSFTAPVSSSLVCSRLTSARKRAAPGIPRAYQQRCFLISAQRDPFPGDSDEQSPGAGGRPLPALPGLGCGARGRRKRSSVSRKIHGFPRAPRAIITPSQPVSLSMASDVGRGEEVAAPDHRQAERLLQFTVSWTSPPSPRTSGRGSGGAGLRRRTPRPRRSGRSRGMICHPAFPAGADLDGQGERGGPPYGPDDRRNLEPAPGAGRFRRRR